MARVGFQEALHYGYSLIAYSVFVILFSALFFGAGAIIAGGAYVQSEDGTDLVYTVGTLAALLLGFLGYLSLIAGFGGMLYKVIADAVNRGQSINNLETLTTAHTPAGLPPVSTKPKAITKSARFDDFEF